MGEVTRVDSGDASEWTIEQWVAHGRKWIVAGLQWRRGMWWIGVRKSDGHLSDKGMCYVDGDSGVNDAWEAVPDMRNPGTRGHALAQVRARLGCPSLRCGHTGGWGPDWNTWLVDNPPGRGHGCVLAGEGTTEHEALLAAFRRGAR